MSASPTLERIYKEVQELPEESLPELEQYIAFLKFKVSESSQPPTESKKPLSTDTIRRLEGLLEGYDFSPELLAEARREMWRGFGDREI